MGLFSSDGIESIRGAWLIGLITSVCSSGFLLFGYDQGVMSGVVISSYWLDTMGNPTQLIVGTITALYDVGAIFGAVFAAFTGEPLGRKRTLLLGALIVLVGGILMGTSFSRSQFMVARIVTGFGIGYITSVTPVYQSEVSASEQRGWQVCCQLTTMLGGLMLAYWINYGLYFHAGSVQWRFPLVFQCVFALYILAVCPFLPDTPRWLMRHHGGDPGRGLAVLARLRNRDRGDRAVRREGDEIRDAIRLESRAEGSWTDLFRSDGIHANRRFYLSLAIQFMQQMTGINIVTYYAPTLYTRSLGMSQETALFLGCFTQLWYVLASFVTWYTIDRVGRRKLFMSMALGMTGVLVAEAICVAVGNTQGSVAAVVFVFLFEACFTWGWMATVWVYPPEVLPLKIRAKGAALAAAADFVGNFLVVEVTPVGIQNIGWRFYIVWAVLNLANAAIVWCFFPETGGLHLEAVDDVFAKPLDQYDDDDDDDDDDGHGGSAAIRATGLHRLQWARVRVADRAVRRAKAARKAGSGSFEDSSDSGGIGKDGEGGETTAVAENMEQGVSS